jgi:hypothetical protein
VTPERVLRVLVPAHHDAGRCAWSRLDRLQALVDCLDSILAAAEHWRERGGATFDEVGIVLVDDGSPRPLSELLRPDLRKAVDVLRLDTRHGQGAALNAALAGRAPAAAYAITDSDCVVAEDWITRIAGLAGREDGTDGTAGPPWPHREAHSRRGRWLTAGETALVRYCTERAAREGTTRLDCRNVWLRGDAVGRDLFPEDAGAALSGMTSRKLADAGVRLGFDPGLRVRHAPLTSVRAQLVTYFSRGATSDLATHYARGHASLRQAFVRTYAARHFRDPIRAGVSPAYVLLAHGAYWCGLARRSTRRSGRR